MEQNSDYSVLSGRFDLYGILRDIVRNLWAILLVALAAGMIVNVYARVNHQTSYSSKAMFAVKSKSSNNYSRTNLTAASTMATSFGNILNSSLLKKKVCEDLQMETFDARASAQVISKTNLITISVTADTPYKAYTIMCSTMRVIDELVPYVSTNMVLEVLQEPSVPGGADATFTGRNEAIKGFLIGAALMTMVFALLSYFKNTVKSEGDLEKKVGGRILGVIDHQRTRLSVSELLKRQKDTHLITDVNADFKFVEKIKKIGATLTNHMRRHDQKVVLFTSVNAHEGKSTVAANVALALAEQDQTVLLIDGDLRNPTLFKMFYPKQTKLANTLNGLIAGRNTTKDTVRRYGGYKLFMLLNDKGDQESTDIVASQRMRYLVSKAKAHFDYVVIDSPPLALMSDAEAFAEMADLTVLVVKYDYSTAEDINDAVDTLSGCKAEHYGTILNDYRSFIGERAVGGYGAYNRYGYGAYGKYGTYGKYGAYGHYAGKESNE